MKAPNRERSVHFCRFDLKLRGVSSPRPRPVHIAVGADALLPRISGSADVNCADDISVAVIATGTFVVSVFCMVPSSTYRTGLAGICRVHVFDPDSCQLCLVLNVARQAIEGPRMQVVFVFTAFPCRAADICELLHLDCSDAVLHGKVYNLYGELVVGILHDALFFILNLFDSIQLLGFA